VPELFNTIKGLRETIATRTKPENNTPKDSTEVDQLKEKLLGPAQGEDKDLRAADSTDELKKELKAKREILRRIWAENHGNGLFEPQYHWSPNADYTGIAIRGIADETKVFYPTENILNIILSGIGAVFGRNETRKKGFEELEGFLRKEMAVGQCALRKEMWFDWPRLTIVLTPNIFRMINETAENGSLIRMIDLVSRTEITEKLGRAPLDKTVNSIMLESDILRYNLLRELLLEPGFMPKVIPVLLKQRADVRDVVKLILIEAQKRTDHVQGMITKVVPPEMRSEVLKHFRG